MNGTVVDIPGITVNITPIDLEDSTDLSHIISIKDGVKQIEVTIAFGKIIETHETLRSSKHE